MFRALAFTACSFAACSPGATPAARSEEQPRVTQSTPVPAPTPDAGVSPEIAPKPHTLDQLRAGCPAGRVVELRIESQGKPTVVTRMTFTRVDDEGATLTEATLDEKGQQLAEESASAKWTELSDHAAFPRNETKIEETDVEVPAGRFRAKLYTVSSGATVKRLWFAIELPGPPVLFTTVTDGKEVFRLTMLRAK